MAVGALCDGGIIPAYAGSTYRIGLSGGASQDHPRIRGEHTLHPQWVTDLAGSSPHTRGALGAERHGLAGIRIIPAYAGSTFCRRPCARRRRDHPRIRGEHFLREPAPRPARGSSPHTRGAHRQLRLGPRSIGIIPAYAGSTDLLGDALAAIGDHPRIRGEHSDEFRPVEYIPRIIPAYAGSTFDSEFLWGPGTDHPRIRGEHVHIEAPRCPQMGSSPHTRGALARRAHMAQIRRIIPAYAGSTRRRTAPGRRRGDHPRIRGEHRSSTVSGSPSHGSSPHTRGARAAAAVAELPGRIIPAYAGSTGLCDLGPEAEPGSSPHTRGARRRGAPRYSAPRIIPAYAGSTTAAPQCARPPADHPRIRGEHVDRSARARPDRRDHPRIRGEHAGAIMWGRQQTGSSPHTRGAHHEGAPEDMDGRIIPAYAGSTSPDEAIPMKRGDHPRIRGEHGRGPSRGPSSRGSSPHTRGAQSRQPVDEAIHGIIPAYAGSTYITPPPSSTSPDHPRIRGEHLSERLLSDLPHGSSPHTRGAPHEGLHVARRSRIIPAYAGSTTVAQSANGHGTGSSPHTRGARVLCRRSDPDRGIIPAYAGSTCQLGVGRNPDLDHPRIRGEHPWFIDSRGWLAGSSPHTRGAHFIPFTWQG